MYATRLILDTNEFRYEWVLPYPSEACPTYERVLSHKWMSRVTHTNESWHTHQRVMSHKRMSHVTGMNESCLTLNSFGWTRSHTYQWGMSHLPMRHDQASDIQTWNLPMRRVSDMQSHVAHKNESFRTHEWVMSHIWMSHTHEYVMSYALTSHTYEKQPHHPKSFPLSMSIVTHTNEWGDTNERDTWSKSQLWKRISHTFNIPAPTYCIFCNSSFHVTHMNKSGDTYECVKQKRMGHAFNVPAPTDRVFCNSLFAHSLHVCVCVCIHIYIYI